MPIPRPPERCPWCQSYDSWEDIPRMQRTDIAGPMYTDNYRCGICGNVWRVPMPVHLTAADALPRDPF